MSASQSMAEFNYVVNICCEDLDGFNPSEIADVNVSNTRKNVKRNLKNRISKEILQGFDSIGSVHLNSDTFSSSSKRRDKVVKSINFGGSSGKTTNLPEESSIIKFRLSINSFVDYSPQISKGDFDEKVGMLWEKIGDELDGKIICVDSAEETYGELNIRSPEESDWWKVDPYNTQDYNGQMSHMSETSDDETVKRTAQSEFLGTGLVNGELPDSPKDTLSVLDENIDEKEPMEWIDENQDDLDEFIDRFQKYEDDNVGVRKPREDEIETVVSAIHNRIMEIMDKEDPVYLEEIPEEWKNATCCCSDCDERWEVMVSDFRDKNREVIKNRLKTDFGIKSSPNTDFKSSVTTNFFVSENGEILFRPEEIISYVVSILHNTEPYCSVCHNEIIGNNHNYFSNNLVVTRKTQEEIEKTDNNVDESLNTQNPRVSFEHINIDEKLESEDINFDSNYRSLTRKERDDISESISNYVLTLATRDLEENPESDKLYKTLFKRDYELDYNKLSTVSCEVCESPVSRPSSDRNHLRQFIKHHIEPVSSNRCVIIIKQIEELLSQSIGTNAKYAPVKVSEGGERFLFSDKFLSLIETLYTNVDSIALFCDDCKSELQEEKSYEIQDEVDKSNNTPQEDSDEDSEEYKQSIFNMSFDVSGRERFEFICIGCDREGRDNTKYWAESTGECCYYITDNNKRVRVPVFTKGSIISMNLPVGLCSEHKGLAQHNINEDEIHNKADVKEEKVRQLMNRYIQLY